MRSTDEFDGDATTCNVCLTAPTPTAPRKRTAPVTRTRTAPRPPQTPAEPAVRRPLLGSVGSGDLEVRERRARRAASEALAQSHPEEFALLLRDARAAEGLRPLGNGSSANGDAPTGTSTGEDAAAAGADGPLSGDR